MGGKDSRVFEKYLMGILWVLRSPANGRTQTDQGPYTRGKRVLIVSHTSSVVDETCLSQS